MMIATNGAVLRPRAVLFLCTGNYYRSRFAELLFDHLAREAGLAWHAESRGLALELGIGNVGPIAPTVIEALRMRAIAWDATGPRFPLAVQPADLTAADLIIALDEQEHRPFLSARFSDWAQRVEYWHVHDLGFMPAEVALAEIEQETRRLIRRLQAQG